MSLDDSQTVATLFAQLHDLREDVKILLGNQKQSSKLQRTAAVSYDGNSSISDIKTCNGGMDFPMPSTAEEALNDLKVEMKSLRIAMQADLRTIKESFLAKFEALGPQRSQELDAPHDCHPSIRDVAVAMHQHNQGKV
jgi:hypothetical protein